jgi:hypothetical protein
MINPGVMILLGDPFPAGSLITWDPTANMLSFFTEKKGMAGLELRGSQVFGEKAGRVLGPILQAHPSSCTEEVVLAQSELVEQLDAWLLLQGCQDKLRELGLVVKQGLEGYVLLPY